MSAGVRVRGRFCARWWCVGAGAFFGVVGQFNYTKLKSSLSYILDPGDPGSPTKAPRAAVLQSGPMIGASPTTNNVTLHYETPKFGARVSMAYRSRYATTYPIASGACSPGSVTASGTVCTSPPMNDFMGSTATRYYDSEITYNIGDHLTLTLEALNLTSETDNRWVYAQDPIIAQYSAPGRQYFAGFRLQF